MLSSNATQIASPAFPNPAQTALPPPANRLSEALEGNRQTSRSIEILPERGSTRSGSTALDPQLPIPCPVFAGLLGANDLPDSLKEGAIYDQSSLEKEWSSLENQLRDGPISEEDVLQTLRSGILQTDTGKALAPLFVEAMLRSFKPEAGLSREFVKIICHLPPDRWADSFGENVNFPRGSNGEGVHGFIQSQLVTSRTVRDQHIAAGELLDDGTWDALREFTQHSRQYFRPSSEAQPNIILRQLEDLVHIRPSPKEAQWLMNEFVEALNEPLQNERQRWRKNFPATAQKLAERLQAIEIVDNRPQRSWLEEIVDPESLRATLSTVATPINTALNTLGSLSLHDVRDGLENAAHYFAVDTTTEPAQEDSLEVTPPQSQLVSAMHQIEAQASFYNDVVTTGPQFKGGLAGKVLYALNVLDTVGFLSVAGKVKPYMPAVPMAAPAIQPQRQDVPVSPASLKAKAVDLEALVNDFIASIKFSTGTGSEEKISTDPGPVTSPASSSALPMLEQLAESIRDVLGRVDNVLTFPSASAAPPDVELQLRAMEEGEEYDPLQGDSPYSDTVGPSSSWRETLAPAINQVVTQLASAINTLGGYAIGTAATGFQLARNNPLTTATVGLVGAGGSLATLGTYLVYFKNQLPEQPTAGTEPDNALPPLENGAAPSQQQIDDELESNEDTSVVTPHVATDSGKVTSPIESTTLPQAQIDEETTVDIVDSVPDDLPVIETAAAHQQRIDDEIESIVDTPLAEGLPPLSDNILELMYESSDDEILLQEIQALLKQHGTKNPEQSYSEQIQAVLADDFAPNEAVAQLSDSGLRSSRTRREAAYASESVAAVASAQSADVEQNLSDGEVEVLDYLAKMDALKRPDIDPAQGIDIDADLDRVVAIEVMRVMRSRRSAGYTDVSRADGDKQLAARYATALRRAVSFTEVFGDTKINVQAHSTFGQCWQNFIKAIKDPFFSDWAVEVGLDLATVTVDVTASQLTGMVKGTSKTFTLTDNSGWAYHAPLILDAAKVIDTLYNKVPYPSVDGKIPVKLVAGFYGENIHLARNEYSTRANDLDRQGTFSAVAPNDPLRPQEPRDAAILKREKRHLGDRYNHHALILALKDLINGKSDTSPVDLSNTRIPIDRDSSFAAKHPTDAQRMVSAQTFINDNPWVVPKNVAEVQNLIDVLSFPLPRSPEFENYRGALGDPTSLTPAQRAMISNTVGRITDRFTGEELLAYLLRYQTVLTPAQGLDMALSGSKAQELGRQLVANLGFISTPYSANGLVLAALLLDLDPTLGQTRNHIAGYDLAKDDNWGKKPSAVVADLVSHLTATPKLDAQTAPVAAHHLLTAIAPEFLVKGLPDNLVCGSATWAMLRLGVARIELLAKGASAKMSFEDVMKYGALLPITVGEDIAVRALSEPPLLDWAIANGIIAKNASGTYSPSQITIARDQFVQVSKDLADARSYSQAPVPTLEGFARADLIKVFGPDVPLESASLIEKRDRKERYTRPPLTTSLLNAHMSGQLQSGKWESLDPKLDIAALEPKFKDLDNVIGRFNPAFTEYFQNLQKGSAWALKNLFSQLSVEDRKNLQYGTQTFYSVREAVDTQFTTLTTEMKDDKKGFHGLLLRSEYKGNIIYLEIFPDSSQIRKNSLLPKTLKLGGVIDLSITSITSPGPKYLEQGTRQPVDFQAYQKGTSPQDSATSIVIFEEITPSRRLDSTYPSGFDFDAIPNVLSSASRITRIAHVAVESHFIRDEDSMRELAKGETDLEKRAAWDKKINEFLLGLIPFKSAIDNFAEGKMEEGLCDLELDAYGFMIPAAKAGSKISKVAATSGMKVMSKAMKSAWIATRTVVVNANPADGFGDLIRSTFNAAGRLSATAYRGFNYGVGQLADLFGTTKAIAHADLLKRADFAEGMIKNADGTGLATPIPALYKDGQWYAFDVARNRPYGAPLENFTPDSSVSLELTTFSDGTTALTPSRLFADDAHILQRSTGTDVLTGDKIYSFEGQELVDITSPVNFKNLEGFDVSCGSGGRSKRDTSTCVTKTILLLPSEESNRLQAFEHKRFNLLVGEPQHIIYEGRYYDCTTLPCIPHKNLIGPLHYKLKTRGSIIDSKHFGFTGSSSDAILDAQTRVVSIDGIIPNSKLKIDVRAFIIKAPHPTEGMKTYLVAEVDRGRFYYCEYDGTFKNNIEFTKVDLDDKRLGATLYKRYAEAKEQLVNAAKDGLPNEEFIVLPTLKKLQEDLLASGTTQATLDDINKVILKFSEKEKREFLLIAWNRNNLRNVEVAVPALQIKPMAKPRGFDTLGESEKNKLYAEEGLKRVAEQLEASGLGPANQRVRTDVQDVRRQTLTESVVIWAYNQWIHKGNGLGVIQNEAAKQAVMFLRSGSGNCDQMAAAAWAIAKENGADAHVWGTKGHTYTMIGGPPDGYKGLTTDFSQPEFANAWISDPWLGLFCPAPLYKTRFGQKLIQWSAEGREISRWVKASSAPNADYVKEWIDPTNPTWRDMAVDGPKYMQY